MRRPDRRSPYLPDVTHHMLWGGRSRVFVFVFSPVSKHPKWVIHERYLSGSLRQVTTLQDGDFRLKSSNSSSSRNCTQYCSGARAGMEWRYPASLREGR